MKVAISNTVPTKETTIQELINRINKIDRDLSEKYRVVRELGWDIKNDLRMNLFNNLSEVNIQTILHLSFETECIGKLHDKNWLSKRIPHHKDTFNKIQDFSKFCATRINISINMIKNDFLLSYFSEIESKFRLIVKRIKTIKFESNRKSIKYLQGTEPFTEIYKSFLNSYLKIPKRDYQVIKMINILRNTIHNSGYYYNIKGKNISVSYRGNSYLFKQGKPVNFVSDEIIEQIILDLNTLLLRVLTHKKIIQYKFLEDPVRKIRFTKK